MKKCFLALLFAQILILSGCMTTGPIVDDLNHYEKGDTYQSIRNEEKNDDKGNDEEIIDDVNFDEVEDNNIEEIEDNNFDDVQNNEE